jgi:hypothetical protein
MLPRTIFLSRLAGLFCLVFAIAALMHKAEMVEMSTEIVNAPALLLIYAMFTLLAGLAMVLAHNIWTGGAMPVVVTVVGWMVLIKGAALMLMTPGELAGIIAAGHYPDFYYEYTVITLLLGVYLTYAGFSARQPAQRV